MSSIQELGLTQLRDFYGLRTFIETGCFQGGGIAAALNAGFEDVYSCDIDPASVEHCQNRFADNDGVHLLASESTMAITEFCRISQHPSLFWLDAHFPTYYGNEGADTASTRFPLPLELEIISKRANIASDVIAFDDLRVIHSDDNPRWRDDEVPDYFVIEGLTLGALTSPFNATHEFQAILAAEGIGLLTPRSKP